MHPDEEALEAANRELRLIAGLAVGRIVHYVLESGHCKGDHRPAIVVRDWQQESGLVQLQVFTDGWNDGFKASQLIRIGEQETAISIDQNTIWRTSVHYSEAKEPGTWHFPERA